MLSEQLPQHRWLFSFLAPHSAVGFPRIVSVWSCTEAADGAGGQSETSTEVLSEDKLAPLTVDVPDNVDS